MSLPGATVNTPPVAAGAFAPVDASYVVMGLDATLTAERVLTAGTGIAIADGGAGGAVTISATSDAGPWNQTGTVVHLDTATNTVSIGAATGTQTLRVVQAAASSGSPTAVSVEGGAHTALAAGVEAIDVQYDLARTVQFTAGAITLQRAVNIAAPTYAFTGASTITRAVTLEVNSPSAGTNATITDSFAARFIGTARTGATERIVEFQISDASNDFLRIQNGTSTNGRFIPDIFGRQTTSNTQASLIIRTDCPAASDSGDTALLEFRTSRDTGVALTARPLSAWFNAATERVRFTLTGQIFADDQASSAIPSFAVLGDPNTGLGFPLSDRLGLVCGGLVTLLCDNQAGIAAPVNQTRDSSLAFQPDTPATLTADQDDYDTGDNSWARLSSDASRTITGIAGNDSDTDGRILVITNVGANDIVLANQNASSVARNRIITGTGANITLVADNAATLIYDDTTQRWRVKSVQQ